MITTRTRTATAVLIGVAALTLSACGSSNDNVPSAGSPTTSGAATTSTPATAAPSQPSSAFAERTDCTTGGYSALGGFTVEQVASAVATAQEVSQAAQAQELVSDLVAQTTEQRLGYVSDYLTADMRAYLADPANATVLEGFVLDPAATEGEQFQTDAYKGVSLCVGVPTLSGPNGDAITVPIDTDTLLPTTGGTYEATRSYSLEMVPATGLQHEWLVRTAHVDADLAPADGGK